MENYLIITNADMSLQSGDVVLINRRAEEFYKQFNIKTLCLVLNNKKKITHKTNGLDYKSINNFEDIKENIIKINPTKIIFYGIRSYSYISLTKKLIHNFPYNIEILLDLQGALEEIIEFKSGLNFIKNYPKYLVKKFIFLKALNKVDGAFVVSNEMKLYCYAFLKKNMKTNFKIYKVRCGINEVISTEKKILWRNKIRELWGIEEDTVVMVFSGYRMPWQNIDTIIETFKNYDKKIDKIYFAFFCNIDEEFKNKIKCAFPDGNYYLKFLKFEEYFEYLSACDLGFLVRDYNITNKVAFPNKFSDYLNAGLMIAMNKAVPEPFRLLEENNIPYINIEENLNNNLEQIKERHKNLLTYYGISESLCTNELLYSKQIRSLI